jgi:hypothetical protein
MHLSLKVAKVGGAFVAKSEINNVADNEVCSRHVDLLSIVQYEGFRAGIIPLIDAMIFELLCNLKIIY